VHVQLSTSRLPDHLLPVAFAVLPGAKLGAALLPGSGHQLSAMLVLGTGHELLHPCGAGLPDGIYSGSTDQCWLGAGDHGCAASDYGRTASGE
jgi:hypothetical protein